MPSQLAIVSPSYHMYAFPGPPTGLDTQLSASAVMSPVSETPEYPDTRCRLSIGFTNTLILPKVAVNVISPTEQSVFTCTLTQ